MCGFAGFISTEILENPERILHEMGISLFHRGPDNVGKYIDSEKRIGLVHTRLSILDLSDIASQPMFSRTKNNLICFNGEIYNYKELRVSLSENGVILNTKSDTEVLLEHIELFGIDHTLEIVRGMFAFAIYNLSEKSITLVRDRAGEKPLYYGSFGKILVFGSELKPLLSLKKFDYELNTKAANQFLSYGFISSGTSIFKSVKKLEPGKYCTFKNVDGSIVEVKSKQYWFLQPRFLQSRRCTHNSISENVYANELEFLLKKSVQEQMNADVPVGAFLSGGIDSSIIVSLMQELSDSPVQTFSIGFEDSEYNEAENAKMVAHHLGTKHNTLYLSESDLLDTIPKLVEIYDEPMSDMSQIPTYILSMFARKTVKVCLTGDGGDELFGGYNRYKWAGSIVRFNKHTPFFLRKLLGKTMHFINPSLIDNFNSFFPRDKRISELGLKVKKCANGMLAHNPQILYENILNQMLMVGIDIEPSPLRDLYGDSFTTFDEYHIEEMFMHLDFNNFMSDSVLCKVDRASMAASLETRVPFLDKRVIEFSQTLPIEYKLRENETKYLLRNMLYKRVPRELIDRPKMGFAVPMAKWLRGPLANWAYSILEQDLSHISKNLETKHILKMFDKHYTGKANYQNQIWTIITFLEWHKRYI